MWIFLLYDRMGNSDLNKVTDNASEKKGNRSRSMSQIATTRLSVFRKAKSKEIESYLASEKKKYKEFLKEPKILLLGSSDSGKSTLLKQLKIMHSNGFTEKEKEFSKKAIVTGIVHAVATLINVCDNEDKRKTFQNMVDFGVQWNVSNTSMDDAHRDLIKKVWDDESIKEAFKKDNGLPDTTEYFLSDLERFLDPQFEPTNDDILNLRTVTQTVSDSVFDIKPHKVHCISI
jgi:guanine nucleotide-binding protein subunit alpha, other